MTTLVFSTDKALGDLYMGGGTGQNDLRCGVFREGGLFYLVA